MKKLLLLTVLFSLLLVSANSQLRLKVIGVNQTILGITGDLVVLHNAGSTTVDTRGYRLCSKFNYATISDAMNPQPFLQTDLILDAGQDVFLNVAGFLTLDTTGADLGLYTPTGDFTDTTAMLDFVQWKTAGNGRESVAVSKGIWGTGDYVNEYQPYTYGGDYTRAQHGVIYWTGTGVIAPNAIPEEQEETGIKVYPTIIDQEFTINVGDKTLKEVSDLSFELYNITGKLVSVTTVNRRTTTITRPGVESGLYIYTVKDGDKVLNQGKIVFK